MEAESLDQILSTLHKKIESGDFEGAASYLKEAYPKHQSNQLVHEAIKAFQASNRLGLLTTWLEGLLAGGSTDGEVATALAKLYVQNNTNTQAFLTNNNYYDCKEVGRYCEEIDPHLALIAYKKGQHTQEIIELTNRNALYNLQAKYLLQAGSADGWNQVFDKSNSHRGELVEQLHYVLSEEKEADNIVKMIQALMSADDPHLLIEVLESVLMGNEFSANRNLQNLLIITAIKVGEKEKVDIYLQRFDNYSAADIATIAESYGLYDQAIAIYKNTGMYDKAIELFLEQKKDPAGARWFVESLVKQEVWITLGDSYLKTGMVDEAMEIYLQEGHTSNYKDVIGAASKVNNHEIFAKYLRFVRNSIKDAEVDNELGYSLVKSKELQGLEELLGSENLVDVKALSERCSQEGLTEAVGVISKAGNY